MLINTYDDTKIRKRGIWVTITKASCIVNFKPRQSCQAQQHFHYLWQSPSLPVKDWMYFPENSRERDKAGAPEEILKVFRGWEKVIEVYKSCHQERRSSEVYQRLVRSQPDQKRCSLNK